MTTVKPLPPLLLPCPVCGAVSGEGCFDARYIGRLGLHVERLAPTATLDEDVGPDDADEDDL